MGERRDLPAHAFQIAVDVARLDLGLVAFLMLGILGRDAGDAVADMALHAGNAAAGDDRRGAQGDGVGAQAQRLDRIDAVADAAHQHDLDGVAAADLVEGVERLDDRREGRNADIFHDLGAARPGRALHAVELDEIEAVLDRDLDIVADATGAQLDRDRQAIAGRLAQLLDLDDQIVGAQNIRVARRRAQIDARRDAADFGQFLGHLLGHELAAEARLGALADVYLQAVGAVHVVDVPAQPPAEALEDKLLGGAPLGIAHAALAGVLGDVRERRGDGDGLLGRARQGAVAHGRDQHRHGEVERVGAVLAADQGVHLDQGYRIGNHACPGHVRLKGQVREMRKLARPAVAAHPIAADLRLDMDIFLNLRVPIIRLAREAEEGEAAHLLLGGFVAQVLAGVDDLLEAARMSDFIAI